MQAERYRVERYSESQQRFILIQIVDTEKEAYEKIAEWHKKYPSAGMQVRKAKPSRTAGEICS